jgi:hypothetical protein
MSTRTILARRIRLTTHRPSPTRYVSARTSSTTAHPPPPPTPNSDKSWLTRRVLAPPTAFKVFKTLTDLLGYGSPAQITGRRTSVLYRNLCTIRADEEKDFWLNSASYHWHITCPSHRQKLIPLSRRLLPATHVSILVHYHEPSRLAPHRATPRSPSLISTDDYTGLHRAIVSRSDCFR